MPFPYLTGEEHKETNEGKGKIPDGSDENNLWLYRPATHLISDTT